MIIFFKLRMDMRKVIFIVVAMFSLGVGASQQIFNAVGENITDKIGKICNAHGVFVITSFPESKKIVPVDIPVDVPVNIPVKIPVKIPVIVAPIKKLPVKRVEATKSDFSWFWGLFSLPSGEPVAGYEGVFQSQEWVPADKVKVKVKVRKREVKPLDEEPSC